MSSLHSAHLIDFPTSCTCNVIYNVIRHEILILLNIFALDGIDQGEEIFLVNLSGQIRMHCNFTVYGKCYLGISFSLMTGAWELVFLIFWNNARN